MKRRKINITNIFNLAATMCLITFVFFLLSRIFIVTVNNQTNKLITANKAEIVRLQSEVDIVTAQVKELSSYSQVVEVINEKEMKVTNGSSIDLN